MNDDDKWKEFFKEPKARRRYRLATEKLKEFTEAELVALRQRRKENGLSKPGDVSRN